MASINRWDIEKLKQKMEHLQSYQEHWQQFNEQVMKTLQVPNIIKI